MNPRSMKPLPELLKMYNNPKVSLTLEEERLVDRYMFEKTGQHIGKFKDKENKKPAPDEIVIGKPQPGAPSPTVVGSKTKANRSPIIATTIESVS